jgi:glycosyltransferase involved in cell wall biosynthesis
MTDRPLRIALINNLYPPYIVGGNEMLAHNVVQALRSRGHTVHVLTGRGRDLPSDGFTHPALDIDLDQKEGIFLGGLPLTAQRAWNWHLYNERTRQGVTQALKQIEPDLVICWNLYMASAAPLIAARRLPWPVIAHPADKWLLYTLNNIRALVPAGTRAKGWMLDGVRALVQPVLRSLARPDYILAVSEFIRRLHTEAGYDAERSIATWLGVDVDVFAAAPHPFPEGRPWRLIFAGQLWSGKGPQVAVQAMAILRERGDLPPMHLDLYGGGAEGFRTFLAGEVERLGLGDVVTLHGFAPQAALADAFRAADVYLFCSIWDEPFSGGLLEAMATGLPVIATTAGGTPEAIRDGENGLLVPPDDPQALADAIARLMHEPELHQKLGRAATDEVNARWSFSRYVDRLERLYTEIVAGHRPGAPIALTPIAPTLFDPWPPDTNPDGPP